MVNLLITRIISLFNSSSSLITFPSPHLFIRSIVYSSSKLYSFVCCWRRKLKKEKNSIARPMCLGNDRKLRENTSGVCVCVCLCSPLIERSSRELFTYSVTHTVCVCVILPPARILLFLVVLLLLMTVAGWQLA